MSYTPRIAAALSGASLRQLSYWRSLHTPEQLLRPELYQPRSRVVYSFQDVLALRTFVYLLSREVPLQRVRKAVRSLRNLGATEHLSSYRLVASGRDVTWLRSDDDAVDLTGHPGHQVIAEMADILKSFRNKRRTEVVDFQTPRAGVRVDPDVRGGYPVIEGTRIPYDLVASLSNDGLSAKQITAIYPAVNPSAVKGAADFAQYVAGHRDSSTAA